MQKEHVAIFSTQVFTRGIGKGRESNLHPCKFDYDYLSLHHPQAVSCQAFFLMKQDKHKFRKNT